MQKYSSHTAILILQICIYVCMHWEFLQWQYSLKFTVHVYMYIYSITAVQDSTITKTANRINIDRSRGVN